MVFGLGSSLLWKSLYTVSCSTGYAYEKADKKLKKYLWNEVIGKCFSDDEETKSALLPLALCLIGENRFENVYIWQGSGSNGKSLLQFLVMQTFGDGDMGDGYAGKLDANYLMTSKDNGKSADPMMAGKKNCRAVFVS